MERLTKTYKDGTHGASDNLPCGENSYDYKNLLIEKLGEYEDLEEQGRLVKLPCKAGDNVYEITRTTIRGYDWKYLTYKKAYVRETVFSLSRLNDICKTIFLTKAEAEAKLKELRGGENE